MVRRKGEKYKKRRMGERIGDGMLWAFMLGVCVLCLFPFWYFLVLSFNDGYDTLYGGVYLWPRVFTLDNYRQAFAYPTILNSFAVSIARVLIQTLVSLIFTALMAYAMTEKELPGRKGINFIFFFTTIFSGGLIPSYILYRQIHILNTFWVLVLPGIFSFYNTIVMRTFFEEIPESLKESAKLDGAGEFTIFCRIILPLSKAVMATVALFVGVGAWNDWFSGAYYIQFNQKLVPAATLLYQIIAEASFKVNNIKTGSNIMAAGQDSLATAATTPESLRMAFVIIIVTPVICIYPFLQKYFVKGVMVGSVKG